MCTAISFTTKDHYFGRNLDLEYSYDESITITPRNYPFSFREVESMTTHYAIIGMAYVAENYPLYYDATNEYGLSMAGLNFPDNASYRIINPSMDNISSFEFIPWILGQCKTVSEALPFLSRINLTSASFSKELPPSPLHWILSDKEHSLTIEPMKTGLKIYENPIGVLTNNPSFDFHTTYLNHFMGITNKPAVNRFSKRLELTPYSRGMGGLFLPGDLSSASRFVRAAFIKSNSVCGDSETESISQFFHILGSVEQQKGCVELGEDVYEITLYSSCCNTDRGIYYYKTYGNSRITAVDMWQEDLDKKNLTSYPLLKEQEIRYQNGKRL